MKYQGLSQKYYHAGMGRSQRIYIVYKPQRTLVVIAWLFLKDHFKTASFFKSTNNCHTGKTVTDSLRMFWKLIFILLFFNLFNKNHSVQISLIKGYTYLHLRVFQNNFWKVVSLLLCYSDQLLLITFKYSLSFLPGNFSYLILILHPVKLLLNLKTLNNEKAINFLHLRRNGFPAIRQHLFRPGRFF